jgi:3',5'-cyclic AMP phosphodiesterase CpdA
MSLTLAIVTDLHFGPEARFQGKLRKLSHEASPLLGRIAARLRDEPDLRPDLVVNLGDDVEDESRELDLVRYAECQSILQSVGRPILNVAGNHDLVFMGKDDLTRIWGRERTLNDSVDHGGWHFCIVPTLEQKDVDVRVIAAHLRWVEADLAATTLPTIVLMHHSASEQDLGDSRWFSRRPELALVRERAELRRLFERSGKVKAVFNGHVHRNHLDVIAGIPYVTFQSLVENLDDDAPGRPAGAFAIARLEPNRIVIRVHGSDPARYQFELGR